MCLRSTKWSGSSSAGASSLRKRSFLMMKAKRAGRIINISSIVAMGGFPHSSHYVGGSRSGYIGFDKNRGHGSLPHSVTLP